MLWSNTIVKERISATVEERTVKAIERILANNKYRNKSHVIEAAIALLAEGEDA